MQGYLFDIFFLNFHPRSTFVMCPPSLPVYSVHSTLFLHPLPSPQWQLHRSHPTGVREHLPRQKLTFMFSSIRKKRREREPVLLLFIKEIIIFRNTCQVGHLFREEWFNMAPKSVQVWVYSSILIFRKREGNNLWSLYELYFVVLSSVQRSETYVEYFVKSGLQEWETFWMFSNFENFKSKK